MADYRLASLAKTRRRENQEQDTSGFVTLEALMLARQEEERRAQNQLQEHQPPPPPPTVHRGRPSGQENVRPVQVRIAQRVTPAPAPGPLTQARPAHSRSTSAFTEERENQGVTVVRRSSFNTPSRLQRQMDLDNQDYRDGSPEKLWIDSLRRTERRVGYPPTPRHIHQVQPQRSAKLKKAALYQPPPVAPLDSPGGEGMQLAFEMTLDQCEAKRRCSKGSTPTPASRLKNLFTSRTDSHQHPQKTLLGSPRLHRAIFRGSVTRADSNGESVNSPPLSPPEDTVEIQVVNPTTPDYPGLEYPPVFEPGTYTLADASSVLRQRNREAR